MKTIHSMLRRWRIRRQIEKNAHQYRHENQQLITQARAHLAW